MGGREQERNKENKKYISVKKACILFSKDRCTIRRAINKYQIPSYKDGRLTMVDLKELRTLYKPAKRTGRRKKYSPKQLAILERSKPRIKLEIKYLDPKASNVSLRKAKINIFLKENIDDQMKWIIKHLEIYKRNQKRFKAGKANDWGKLYYLAIPM